METARGLIANEKGNEAVRLLTSYTSRINAEYEGKPTITIPAFLNHFYPVDINAATAGVEQMGLEDTGDGNMMIVKIPKDGAIYHHFHNNQRESVMVIAGSVDYIVYKSNIRSKIIAEGELKSGEKLVINPMQTHYVFTSKEIAYLLVTFKRQL